jgi:ubiquinone biosynthesis protein UbiJ
LLNRNVDASAAAGAAARRLEGKSLQLEADGLIRVRVTAVAGHLALYTGDPSPADAVICGSPAALLRLLTGRAAQTPAGRAAALRPAQVRGDAEAARLFRELFALARPDLEEELSRLIGDVPAHRAMRVATQAYSWLRKARRTAGENLAEYLQEESRALVNKTELEEFLHGVDQARESADRIEALLTRLERRLQAAP